MVNQEVKDQGNSKKKLSETAGWECDTINLQSGQHFQKFEDIQNCID